MHNSLIETSAIKRLCQVVISIITLWAFLFNTVFADVVTPSDLKSATEIYVSQLRPTATHKSSAAGLIRSLIGRVASILGIDSEMSSKPIVKTEAPATLTAKADEEFRITPENEKMVNDIIANTLGEWKQECSASDVQSLAIILAKLYAKAKQRNINERFGFIVTYDNAFCKNYAASVIKQGVAKQPPNLYDLGYGNRPYEIDAEEFENGLACFLTVPPKPKEGPDEASLGHEYGHIIYKTPIARRSRYYAVDNEKFINEQIELLQKGNVNHPYIKGLKFNFSKYKKEDHWRIYDALEEIIAWWVDTHFVDIEKVRKTLIDGTELEVGIMLDTDTGNEYRVASLSSILEETKTSPIKFLEMFKRDGYYDKAYYKKLLKDFEKFWQGLSLVEELAAVVERQKLLSTNPPPVPIELAYKSSSAGIQPDMVALKQIIGSLANRRTHPFITSQIRRLKQEYPKADAVINAAGYIPGWFRFKEVRDLIVNDSGILFRNLFVRHREDYLWELEKALELIENRVNERTLVVSKTNLKFLKENFPKAVQFLIDRGLIDELTPYQFYELLGLLINMIDADLWSPVKKSYNDKTAGIYSILRKRIRRVREGEGVRAALDEAILYAAKANMLKAEYYRADFFDSEEIDDGRRVADIGGFYKNLFEKLEGKKGKILYFVDNAGEIFMDLLIVELFLEEGFEVTLVGKEGALGDDLTANDIIKWLGDLLKAKKDEYKWIRNYYNPQSPESGRLSVVSNGSFTKAADFNKTPKNFFKDSLFSIYKGKDNHICATPAIFSQDSFYIHYGEGVLTDAFMDLHGLPENKSRYAHYIFQYRKANSRAVGISDLIKYRKKYIYKARPESDKWSSFYRILSNWEEIKRKGALVFDIDGTLFHLEDSGATLDDPEYQQLCYELCCLLDEGIKLGIITINSKSQQFKRVVTGIREKLKEWGRVHLMQNFTIYTSTGYRTDFDKYGNEKIPTPGDGVDEFNLSNSMPPDDIESIRRTVEEAVRIKLSQNNDFLNTPTEKFRAHVYAERGNELRCPTNYPSYFKDYKTVVYGKGDVPPSADVTNRIMYAPWIEVREKITVGTQERFIQVTIRGLPDEKGGPHPVRRPVLEAVEKALEGKGYKVNYGGGTSIDIALEKNSQGQDINKALALLNYITTEGLDKRFVFYVGDEYKTPGVADAPITEVLEKSNVLAVCKYIDRDGTTWIGRSPIQTVVTLHLLNKHHKDFIPQPQHIIFDHSDEAVALKQSSAGMGFLPPESTTDDLGPAREKKSGAKEIRTQQETLRSIRASA